MSRITKLQYLQHIKDPQFPLTQRLLASCRGVIDSSDDRENTPLIWAAIHNDTNKVIQLAIAGADVHATNKDGDTAMMWAERAEEKNSADIIKQAMGQHPLGVVNPPLPRSRFARVWKGVESPQQQGPREMIIRGSAGVSVSSAPSS